MTEEQTAVSGPVGSVGPGRRAVLVASVAALAAGCTNGGADDAAKARAKNFSTASATTAAERWVSTEFQDSTLAKQQQLDELAWFTKAAAPYRGMQVNVVSEALTVHQYESQTLTKAFQELTGITVKHDILQEGDVIEKLQTQIESGRNIYDAYVNDSDLIGTHSRGNYVFPLSDYMVGEGKAVTSPTLDLKDFIGTSFTTGLDKKLYQLPDQQFANLYWFRHDWFTDPAIKQQFKAAYGYDLGVPVNWAAYEDIADFFSNKVNGHGTIGGKKVYGHMDYGRKDPSLGWRFTDAWLSMAGAGDVGIPNGLPVDEWGIRMEGCRPVGSSVGRGGDTNGPAAVYALTKYIEWLKKYAPTEAGGMNFSEAGPVPAQGNIAQQVFWYTAFTADMIKPGLPVMNADGTPKWRMAPSPHGAYWHNGQKLGYQDCGSWTLLRSTPKDRRAAAWLYGQFVTSKTVSLKKSIMGLTFIRDSDINSDYFTKHAAKYGGLIEFYRSPARIQWTPTGLNVPDYPRMAQLWWPNVATAVTGETTPQQAMDNLARQQDEFMDRLGRRGTGGACAPKLNPDRGAAYWFAQPGAPAPKLADERGRPATQDYEALLASWKAIKT